MLRVGVCAAHMGGFLGSEFSKQGSLFGQFSLNMGRFSRNWQKIVKNGCSFPPKFIIKVGMKYLQYCKNYNMRSQRLWLLPWHSKAAQQHTVVHKCYTSLTKRKMMNTASSNLRKKVGVKFNALFL